MFSFGDTEDNLGDTSLLAVALWITGVAELWLLLPPCRNSDDNSVAGLANLPLTSSTLSSVDILIFEFAFTVVRNDGWFNIFLTSLLILFSLCSSLSAIFLFGSSDVPRILQPCFRIFQNQKRDSKKSSAHVLGAASLTLGAAPLKISRYVYSTLDLYVS